MKVGFGISGKGGEGVVVARTGNGWSGPSFVGTGGAGAGFQIGAQLTEFIFVLNTNAAVRAFSKDGNVTLGADVSAAAGPVGRDLAGGRNSARRGLHLQPEQRTFRRRLARRRDHRHTKNCERALLRPPVSSARNSFRTRPGSGGRKTFARAPRPLIVADISLQARDRIRTFAAVRVASVHLIAFRLCAASRALRNRRRNCSIVC